MIYLRVMNNAIVTQAIEGETVRVPVQSMSELVLGVPARRPRSVLRARAAMLLVAVGLAAAGCATAPRPVETETVGTLSASATHVTTAAVHASTDLSVAYQPAGDDGGDTDGAAVSAVAGESVEAPVVAPKSAHGF